MIIEWVVLFQVFVLIYAASEKDCNEILILPGNVTLTSTSSKKPSAEYGPQQAILHNTHAWCAGIDNADQHLVVDLGLVKMIESISIQGNPKDDEYIKTFNVSYGITANQWITMGTFDSNGKTAHIETLQNLTAARYVRISPVSWYGHVCARIGLFGCDATPLRGLGMMNGDIPDSSISASSTWDMNLHPPKDARLHWTRNLPYQYWAAGQANANQWFQIDLMLLVFISAVATQSRQSHGQMVRSYSLSSSNDSSSWMVYQLNGTKKEFKGNTDLVKPVTHILKPVIYARLVRFHPITWKEFIAMRAEVYSFGKASPADLGIAFDSNEVQDNQITASSHGTNTDPYRGRLNYPLGEMAWCAIKSDEDPWLQFDLGHTMLVQEIVTQARGIAKYNYWVTMFKISFSLNGTDWVFYKHDEKQENATYFIGNSDATGYVTNHFNRDIKARFVRLHPVRFVPSPLVVGACMRATILGRRKGSLGFPVFTNQDTSPFITAYYHQYFTLPRCEAVGDEPIVVNWKRNGTVLGSSPPTFFIGPEHEGFYECTASNKLGENTRLFYIHFIDGCIPGSSYRVVYSEPIGNHAIVGPLLKSITTQNDKQCKDECFMNVPDVCYMFNYYTLTKKCELFYKDRASEYTIEARQGCMFRTRECKMNNCLQGQRCYSLGDQSHAACI